MRRVFSSHSEVCHIWAQQVQFEGRAGNIFFRDSIIFSYGLHFKAAQIHKAKGKRFALVNSERYSPSTGKHLSEIRNSLQGLMPYFESPDVTDVKAAIEHLDALAQASIESALKRMKVANRNYINQEFKWIGSAFESANELRKFMGRAEKHPTKKQLDSVQAHLEKRLTRYHELNTPEMREKRELETAKRKQKEQDTRIAALSHSIKEFREGLTSSWALRELPFELLRIEGEHVVTSRGARVPVQDAKLLYSALVHNKDVKGKTIGDYTVIATYPLHRPGLPDDKQVQIGCHKILMSEAAQLFGAA